MKQKYYRLIQVLRDENGYVTAKNLALKLDISIRSVKNYIAEINKMQSGCIKSSREGYFLAADSLTFLTEEEEQVVPQTPEERVNYIIKLLLSDGKNYKQAINLYDLAEELYVSYETIRKDLNKVKTQIQNFDLAIQISNQEMVLEGREEDIRKMLSSILFTDFSDNVVTIEIIQHNFPGYDVEYLRDMIEEKCKKYHYYINGYSLLNLVLDVLISIERIKNNYIAIRDAKPQMTYTMMGGREMELTKEIAEEIEKEFQITFPKVEQDTLAIMLISYLMHIDYEKIELEYLEEVVGKQCMKLVNALLEDMDTYYFYDIQNADFIIRFALHIRNLMLRLQCGYSTQNALTDHIKTTCPLVFDCAVILSNRIKELTGYQVDEDEIAYIALHIGAILDTQKSLRQSATCTLVFPQYYNLANTLVSKLTEHFGERLLITEIVESAEQLEKAKPAEFIISTVPLPELEHKRYLQIAPFLTERDLRAVEDRIGWIVKQKKMKRLREHLTYMADPEFFYKDKQFHDKEEALLFMTEEMKARGYVTEDFLEEVKDRERNSSTAFSHIAVPHSMKMNAPRTGMFVLLNAKPLDWGNSMVNIVLLFAINKEDRGVFHDVFDNLIVLLLEKAIVNQVLKAADYKAFIDAIMKCYEESIE